MWVAPATGVLFLSFQRAKIQQRQGEVLSSIVLWSNAKGVNDNNNVEIRNNNDFSSNNAIPKEFSQWAKEHGGGTIEELEDHGGFCNHLFRIIHTGSKKRNPHNHQEEARHNPSFSDDDVDYILKVYSPLARARRNVSGFATNNNIDDTLAELGLGPAIVLSNPLGIIMEYIPSLPLNEADTQASNAKTASILKTVATSLAKLHSFTPPVDDDGSSFKNNMLWSSLEVLLSLIGETEEGQYYRNQISWQRNQLDFLELPIVFGHGDFKPSNIIMVMENDDEHDVVAKFIDFEMVGWHFRAFDLAKLFRATTATSSSTTTTTTTDQNRQAFLQQYLQQMEKNNDATGATTLPLLQLESQLLLPMAWLEAAIFFEASASMSLKISDNVSFRQWKKKAKQRKLQYQKACRSFMNDIHTYQQEVKKMKKIQ